MNDLRSSCPLFSSCLLQLWTLTGDVLLHAPIREAIGNIDDTYSSHRVGEVIQIPKSLQGL
jgi:hypothetical protein